MAAGDLSPDQLKFAQLVTAGTGLNPNVVTSWVGAESGWTTYKPTHNYLNIGPGRNYTSVDQAAQATVDLIKSSKLYSGIVASAVQSPTAQLEAIGASPWGTISKSLHDVYASVSGVRVVDAGVATPVDFTLPGWLGGGTVNTPNIPSPGDVASGAASAVAEPLAKAAGVLTAQVLQGALSLVFTTAGIALIGFGLFRVTMGKSTAKAATEGITKTKGHVAKTDDVVGAVTPTGAAGKAAKII